MARLECGVEKIISGGQTGTDRASFDLALELGLPCGGWVPKGRLAEDGVIAARYPVQETPSEDVAVRTEWNARDSDGTLILSYGAPTGGTAWTVECARKYGRPLLMFDLLQRCDRHRFLAWIRDNNIKALNVAGPRESLAPGEIYSRSLTALRELLAK